MLLQFFFISYDALLSLAKYIFFNRSYKRISQDWLHLRKLRCIIYSKTSRIEEEITFSSFQELQTYHDTFYRVFFFYVFSLFASLSMFILYISMALTLMMMSDFDTFSPGHSQYLAFSFDGGGGFGRLGNKRRYFFCSINAHNWSLRLNEKSLLHYLYTFHLLSKLSRYVCV